MTVTDIARVTESGTRRTAEQPRPGASLWVAACGRPEACEIRANSGGVVVMMTGTGRALRLLGGARSVLTARDEVASCGLIFDGVIYNRTELRGQLPDASGPVGDDAQLMLRAYLRWGEEAVRRVKGIFALVVWDAGKNLLLGARDRMGFYPLFYARAGDEVLFSTSPDPLVRHPRVSGALNLPAIADSLCNRFHSPEETFYASVWRVPQGNVMRMVAPDGQGKGQPYRYWNPAAITRQENWIREEHVERFNEALDQAVSRVLAEGPAGIFLSGGLDSVSVAAVAAENSRQRGLPAPWGLSLLFEAPECNEAAVQQGVAAELGMPHLLVPYTEAAGGTGPMMAALELSRTLPSPLMSMWQPAYLHLAVQGRQRGCRGILTGNGGDEFLGVSPLLAADLMRRLDLRGVYRLYRNIRRSHSLPALKVLRNTLWRFGARPLLAGAGTEVLRVAAPGVLRARRRQYIRNTTPAYVAPDPALREEIDRRADRFLPEPRLERSFYFLEEEQSLSHTLVAMELEEIFEMARLAGVRQIPTYLDADLIETLLRMPPEVLNKGGRSKGLVREAMARRFPHLGFDRQKKVKAESYFGTLVRNEARRAWKLMGGVPTLARLGVIEPDVLTRSVDSILSNEHVREEFRIWALLRLEAWARARV